RTVDGDLRRSTGDVQCGDPTAKGEVIDTVERRRAGRRRAIDRIGPIRAREIGSRSRLDATADRYRIEDPRLTRAWDGHGVRRRLLELLLCGYVGSRCWTAVGYCWAAAGRRETSAEETQSDDADATDPPPRPTIPP